MVVMAKKDWWFALGLVMGMLATPAKGIDVRLKFFRCLFDPFVI
jgi:hypothetical protein